MSDDINSTQWKSAADLKAWKKIVAEYQKPSAGRALWQLLNTIGPYLVLWYLIYLSLAVSWWLAVPLAILAGGFLVRVFIIHHDCGHGSFFKSRGAHDNSRSTRTAVGFLAALRPAQSGEPGCFR